MREKTHGNQILLERTFNEAGPVEHKHRPSMYEQWHKTNPSFLKILDGSEMWEG